MNSKSRFVIIRYITPPLLVGLFKKKHLADHRVHDTLLPPVLHTRVLQQLVDLFRSEAAFPRAREAPQLRSTIIVCGHSRAGARCVAKTTSSTPFRAYTRAAGFDTRGFEDPSTFPLKRGEDVEAIDLSFELLCFTTFERPPVVRILRGRIRARQCKRARSKQSAIKPQAKFRRQKNLPTANEGASERSTGWHWSGCSRAQVRRLSRKCRPSCTTGRGR